MGLDFAIVHDASKEAFDLGKWCRLVDGEVPSTKAQLREFFDGYYNAGDDDQRQPELVDPVTDAVWAFIESHPGCRVVNEHDYRWTEAEPSDEDRDLWGDAYCFRQIGSRYDVKATQQPSDPQEKT